MDTRLIEVAFPLRQASLDSVHEKNVRHGHISTLHIWPMRRPLAASHAALIATLLPDADLALYYAMVVDGRRCVRRPRRPFCAASWRDRGAGRPDTGSRARSART
jgi:hypothetical protein